MTTTHGNPGRMVRFVVMRETAAAVAMVVLVLAAIWL
jgi:hypothetical protein